MEMFVEFLHIAPLLIIALLFAAPKVASFIFKKKIVVPAVDSIVLVLASVGIAAGSNAHHAFEHMIDPRFGYAAIWIVLAAKLASMSSKAIARL